MDCIISDERLHVVIECTLHCGLANGASWRSMLTVSNRVRGFALDAIKCRTTVREGEHPGVEIDGAVVTFTCYITRLPINVMHGPVWGVRKNRTHNTNIISYVYMNYWFGRLVRCIVTKCLFGPRKSVIVRNVSRAVKYRCVVLESIYGTNCKNVDEVCACGVKLCVDCTYKYIFSDLPLIQRAEIDIPYGVCKGGKAHITISYNNGSKTTMLSTGNHDLRKCHGEKLPKKYYDLIRDYLP